ncbi:hypothetical protein ABB37_06979 [Leptomonas pyrrhocoris]|uniref:Chorein N-terminal domain-containing protein n=1 Tax=Leptomonas pyrrhocoris TaxID=157538 RepID=A0A0M9FWN7_LEPPY|nr:hypothetical protein ABB37_06979 [Leptomonas pyrrhocoris]XP_015656059.1 hypothetical protein ABB37_06979 [Leptomonas pyrrhocoris]KPA77619.1 hypothetical protein ABB37_06979 [Leptomonas pyrrhocoris]KPA77620.1 hypothetical protein ABB37_06979 [Leptomonas pyrrhocoris]|eukprot:XP_015656058.1 hypothetical protein ABB37_06979 [Leptomonas pyrrhocoris]
MDVNLTIECARLIMKLDENLQSMIANSFVGASKKGENMQGQLSVSSVTIIAENSEDSPLLSITGNGGDTGALLQVSKIGSAPVNGELSIEAITTCLDLSFQEMLFSKLVSYIAAVKPFVHQRFQKSKHTPAEPQDAPTVLKPPEEQSFSHYTITAKSIVASADGVSLRIQSLKSALVPHNPIVVKVQQIVSTVNGANLLQLYSVTVAPSFSKESVMVNVVTDNASLSTDIEKFEYVNLLISATAIRWKREADNVIVESLSFFESVEKESVENDTSSTPVKVSVHFGFIEFGALALDAFDIQATLSDGWHIHLSAAGGSTEGWCHSAPPHPQDPFIDIDIWADEFLQESPFAGNIEGNGIGFLFAFNHVTLCLGDELAATAEALFDVIMLLIFEDEDRHVHLREDRQYTTPHISGRLIGSDARFLLESDGGDLTLLPGYAAAMNGDEASRKAFVIPVPPMPLTIELLGKECLDVTFHRYGDKRMDVAVLLQNGVNAFLRGTPAHIPLLPSREGTRAEINLRLSAPSEADLLVFPYSRVDIAVTLREAAVVAHIPTIMALWTNFNTPSLPLGRVRNVGNRVHFISRPSRPGKTLPPRSPISAALEAIGAAALAQSSPFPKPAAQSESAAATALLEPSSIYTTPVFPSDVTLRVEVEHSELYYTWGEGSVAPLFLHAAVPKCDVVVLNRDEYVEVNVRGIMTMPGVTTSLFASPAAGKRPRDGSAKGDGRKAEGELTRTECLEDEVEPHASAVRSRPTRATDPPSDSLSNRTTDSREQTPSVPLNAAEGHSANAKTYEASKHVSPMLSAFADCEEDPPHSSAIQVHVTYTMDSRPPYRPGASNDTLAVSLSGTAVPGSGALPGPLHICLRDPVEVGAWLTFFTYFNPANTIPLSTSNVAFFSTLSAFANDDISTSNIHHGDPLCSAAGGEAGKPPFADTATGDSGSNSGNTRCIETLVRLAPIVFHLPFAGAAVALWDGVVFSASPGYNALRIPQLEVLVHEELLDGPTPLGATGSSLKKLRALCEKGYSVLSLRGASENGRGGVTAVPGVLLETRQQGPSAAGIRRRLVVPALQGQVLQETTLVQMQSCATLAAVGKVFSARNAQCALLNAVIQHESRRLGLQYACCVPPQVDGTTDAKVHTQLLLPFLSPPMVMLFQNACFTYEWESGLHRDVRAGLTVALHNLRCNDYEAYSMGEQQCGTDAAGGGGGGSDGASRYPLSLSMPFFVDIDSVDAYAWWTSVEADLVALLQRETTQASSATHSSRLTRNLEEGEEEDARAEEIDRGASEERRPAPPSVGACMPLLLNPVRVRTSISSGTPAVAMKPENDDGKQGSQSRRIPPAASTASLHTMPSTSSSSSATAAAPMSPLYTTDVAVAPVFEVSPVHVILSTSAYVMLSDALMRKRHDKGGGEASSDPSPRPIGAHVYYLVRHGVHRPHQEDGSPLSPPRPSTSSAPPLPTSPLSSHRDGRNQGSSRRLAYDSRHQSGSDAARAPSTSSGEALYLYRFDGEEQRVWVEKIESGRPARVVGQSSRGVHRSLPSPFPAVTAAAATTANPRSGEGVTFIPLSSVHTVDGLLSSAVNAPCMKAAVPSPDNPTASEASHTPSSSMLTPLQVVSPQQPQQQASAHVAVLSPLNPTAEAVPRLRNRVKVTELGIRLVLLQDVESSFNMVGEARDFWQRYTAVHTAARRAGIAAEGVLSTAAAEPHALSVLSFLATTVPALHTLLRASTHGSAWSRGNSAMNSTRQRLGPPGPASLLEENCVDALCVQLRGIVVSSFTDARSITLDSCVCTSVKSPSRPLLAVAQAELYLPTSSVTYPSMAVAARSVARDLGNATGRGEEQSQVNGVSASSPPTGEAAGGSKTKAAMSSAGLAFSSLQGTGPAAGVEGQPREDDNDDDRPTPPSRTTATAEKAAHSQARGGGGGRPVVVMGEVGCRVDAITVDISATALRVWLSCLVEQPVAALRAAAEGEEKRVALMGTATSTDNGTESASAAADGAAGVHDSVKREEVIPGSHLTEPVSLLKWPPGRGLRIYEALDPIWSLEHDITLSRNGLVLFFSSHNTNLMTVMLNGYNVILDDALLLQPDGLQRTVMVVQGGLTVRFVGSGRVQLPLGMWNPSLGDSQGNTSVEAVLLPFMAVGEDSYLECVHVRLGFSEPTSMGVKGPAAAAAVMPPLSPCTTIKSDGAETSLPATSPINAGSPPRTGKATGVAANTAVKATPLAHRSIHLVLPRVSLIMEPRRESRQVRLSTAVELWMSVCGGALLRDDLRCTGLTVSSESIYDAAASTARTAVLAPVDVSMCSNNGRHHAVSLNAAQVDLGRADLLLLSTYAGELQALRSYAKYLTHSRVEKEFLELVEATLAWKAAAPVDLFTAGTNDDDDDEADGEGSGAESDDEGEENQVEEEEENPKDGALDGREVSVRHDLPPSQRESKVSWRQGGESSRVGASESLGNIDDAAAPGASRRESGQEKAAAGPFAAIWDSVTSRRSGKEEGNAAAPTDRPAEKKAAETAVDAPPQNQTKDPPLEEQRQRQQLRRRRRQREQKPPHTRGSSWAIYTPVIELTISDHRYPLLQLRVQDMLLRRTSTSVVASTSLLQCQKASLQVYGRGRWDSLLLPSAAVTWSLTQSISRHSSNGHVLLKVEGIRVQCSHLIVAKLLYIARQLKMLSSSLQRRFAAAAAALTGEKAPVAVDLAAPANVDGDGTELQYRLDSHTLSVLTGDNNSRTSGSTTSSNNGDDAESHSSTDSDSSSGTGTEASADDEKKTPHRRARVSAARSTAMSLAFREPAFSSRRALRDATTAGAPGGVPVTAGMATHRLWNSFRYTLFAGICERQAVTAVAAADASLFFSVDSTEAVPTIWHCKELYRLPPASATDVFISYRRARSLVLTFFPAGCVEWDEDAGTWVLNANGETELAAKAVEAMRGPADSTGEEDGAFAARAAINWFPFTTLQYGMARPVAVRTTTRVEVTPPAAVAAAASLTLSRDGTVLYGGSNSSNNSNVGGRVMRTRPRALDVVGGSEADSSYKVQTYALALTCVDPEEEAESLQYPIVVAPDATRNTLDTARRGRSSRQRTRGGGTSAASVTSRHLSAPLSRRSSSAYVDAAAGGAAGMGDGAGEPDEAERRFNRRSVDFTVDPPHDGGPLASPTSAAAAAAAKVQHPYPHGSHVSHPTTAPAAKPHSSPHHRRHGGRGSVAEGGVSNSAALRMTGQGSSHTAAGPVMMAEDSSVGDLLVVRLQARSSLLNETGCTLQLCSLMPAAAVVSDTTSTAAAAASTSVTVPPGWRLPLEEEDVQNEVLLRVCCPSARWVSPPTTTTTDAPPHNSSTHEEDSSEGLSNRDGGAENSGASVDRWYEARLVLGDLDSGHFLTLNRASRKSRWSAETAVPSTVPTAAVAADDAFEDHDKRPLILFVVINYSSDNLIEHIALYPRLTLVNHLGVNARVAVFQQDPAAGPQTPDEAMLLAPWTAPYVGRGRHERERFHRSLVALGAHDALPHQHALPLHFCTYSNNLVLGLSFSQSTGDTLITADLELVVTRLREAVDHHPHMLLLHDSHGRTFYVQVSVMPRTVVLSVALWVYNLTEYPLLMCDNIVRRRLCPGQSSTTGIIPSQGEPFLIGCRLADFTQGFFSIGLDGGWSGAVPIDVGSTGVFVSAQSRLGIQRSCNYSILFPNAQEGRPMVLQITPRWVFYNNAQKRLRIHFRFPGLAKVMREAERMKRRQLLLLKQGAESADGMEAAAASSSPSPQQQQRSQALHPADDNVSTLASLATVQLNPGDYHVSCVGPIEGNQFCVQDVLEGVLPSITSITKDNNFEHRDVAAYYESHLTPYMDVDRPGAAAFNLWAAPRAPGKRVAVSYGGDLIVQRPLLPHPTWLEPYDAYASDAVITGRIAVEVQNTDNVLTVLLQPIQGTKILLQNRTARDAVMVRQQGSRRRNRIPPRQNRFFLWEDARQEHRIRVHILGFKGRWFDVDFSSGECQVTYHEDSEAAAEAEALAAAQQAHPWPTHVKRSAAPHTPFSFFVRGYANREKTRVTIIVTELAIPLYASIDAWRTSSVFSLQVSMVRFSWIQEMSAGVAVAMRLAVPFGAAAAGVDDGGGGDGASNPEGDAEGAVIVVDAAEVRGSNNKTNDSAGVDGGLRQSPLTGSRSSATRRRARSRSRGGGVSSPGDANGSAANPLLFSIILEGLQLERLSTEDTETFFFVIHQMQWIDEKLGSVFVHRARPRLPSALPANAASSSSSPSSPAGATTTASPALSSSPGVSWRTGGRRPAPSSSASSLPLPPSSANRRARAVMLLPRAAVAATTAAAHRGFAAVFGQRDAFLHAMEKPNDVELSYNFIKYADGVTRLTELRCVLTPLVVVLSDFWLADTIYEVRRLRVLLGLRKQAATTQTTTMTTVPMILLNAPAPQPLQQQQQQQQQESSPLLPAQVPSVSGTTGSADADADGTGITVVVAEDEPKPTLASWSALRQLSSRIHCRADGDVVIEAGDDGAAVVAAAVPPPFLPSTTPPVQHNNVTASTMNRLLRGTLPDGNNRNDSSSDTETTASSRSGAQASTYAVLRRSRRSPVVTRRGGRRSGSDSNDTASRHSTRPPTTTQQQQQEEQPATTAVTGDSLQSMARRSRTKRVSSRPQQQQQQQRPQCSSSSAANTAGFVSQSVFLLQLVQEVRVRLQRQGTGLMAGSLSAITTREGKRSKSSGLMSPLRGGGGGGDGLVKRGGHRRQLVPTTVRHHRGALQRGGAGDGLAGATATTTGTDMEGAAGVESASAGAPNTTTTATTTASSNVSTASFMFIERLEVHRVTLYVTFHRHRPDPLRPILGAYAWMLPSQLNQREFYLPAWTLTKQVETGASLRARMVKWGTHSLREQWTKVTKLGTLLDALQFWQHRTLPLHGPPLALTLPGVQRQRQEREGRSILFAPCVSSADDGEGADQEDDEDVGEEALRRGGWGSVAPMRPPSPHPSQR